jgi:hypothetical protein
VPAAGQEPAQTLDGLIRFLVTNQGVQTSDFDKDREAAAATSATIARALLASLAALPVSTSSSGFTYRFNPALGTVERASETFGPFFVERAVTAGQGQATLGFNVKYVAFGSLDGNSLRDGQFLTTANQFTDEPEPFDVEALTLSITAKTATFFGNIGVTDRLDVGVAVPLVRLEINGSRLNTYRGQSLPLASARGESVGLADVLVRSKVRLTPEGPGTAAAGVELRLPTGREEDLLGAGDAQLRIMGLGSVESGSVGAYGSLAFSVGGTGREVSYGGAVAVAATPQLTLVGELVGRRLAGLHRISESVVPHPRIQGVTTTRLMPAGNDRTAAFVVGGFKWNVSGAWLLHGNLALPVTDAGLTARITPTVALDYSFTR